MDGGVYATGAQVDGMIWIDVPEVALFRADPAEVVAFPCSGVDPDEVEEAYTGIVLPLALQALGQELIHSSGVVAPSGEVVAFAATTHAGKSTTAYALARRGHRLWSDDVVLFESDCEGIQSLPLPFSLKIRQPSATFFAVDAHSEDEWRGLSEPSSGPRPLAAICLLDRTNSSEGEPVLIVRRDPSAAFPALLSHSYCFSTRDPVRYRAMTSSYLELVERVPVYDVRFRPGLDHIDELLDAIERDVMAA